MQKYVKFGKPSLTIMTKEEFVSIAVEKYDALQELNKIDNFYDYEKAYEVIINDLSRQVLQANISDVPKDRRKKKRSQSLEKSI
jgi:hypothetical protein